MMLLLVAGAAALVAPGSRPSGAVVCRGAAYDYCVQALGCTAAEASKVEGKLIPSSAKSLTRAQADERCSWLQSSLDLSDAELKKVVMRLPSLLSYKVEANVPKLDWLQKRLDLDDAGLRKVVLGLPPLLGLSVEDNMAPRLDWLQTRLELDEEELKKMVVAFPALLCYSVEANIQPKLGFFEEELGLSPSEVRASIVSAPARLGLSLKKRYRPRLEVCRAVGADVSIVLRGAYQTDADFCKRAGVPLEALRAAQKNV